MLIRKILLMLAGVMAIVLAQSVAGAQEPFPAETLSASTLTAEQHQQIEAFLDEVVAGLASGEAVEIMSARRAAQRELTSAAVRVPFRLEFATIAAPKLAPLTKSDNDLVAINAIYVLGDVAAGQTAVTLLDALKDEREAVRYAAVVGLEKTFTASNPVLPRRDIDVLRRQLAVAFGAEKSSKVVGAYVRTLRSAADPQRGTSPDMRDIAISLLGTTFADRVAKLPAGEGAADPAMMDAMLKAGGALRDELTRVGATMTDEQAKQSARLGGCLLAYVRARAAAGDIGVNDDPSASHTERQHLQTLAQLGEQITIFSGTKLGKSITPPGLPALIEQEKDAQFVTDVMGLIGPDGVLTAPPFGFADDFVRE